MLQNYSQPCYLPDCYWNSCISFTYSIEPLLKSTLPESSSRKEHGSVFSQQQPTLLVPDAVSVTFLLLCKSTMTKTIYRKKRFFWPCYSRNSVASDRGSITIRGCNRKLKEYMFKCKTEPQSVNWKWGEVVTSQTPATAYACSPARLYLLQVLHPPQTASPIRNQVFRYVSLEEVGSISYSDYHK